MLVSNGYITIVDVNDGLNASLSQSSLVIPCKNDGTVTTLVGADTTMKVFLGGVDDSINWNFYVSSISVGIAYSDSLNNSFRTGVGKVNGAIGGVIGYIKITSFTATDSGYVEITASKFGYENLVKRLDLVKAKAGTRGSITAHIKDQLEWTDAVANSFISTNYQNAKVIGDVITQYGAGFAQTKMWSGSAWQLITQIIDGNLIVNGTVTTGAIAVGAIGADQIRANAITTEKLLVTGSGPALNKDPNTVDISAWSGSGISIVSDTTSPVGKTVLRCSDVGAAVLSNRFEIDKTKNYRLKIWIRQFSGNTSAYLTAIFRTSTGEIINGTGWPATYTYNFFGLLDQQPSNTWTEHTISFGPNEVAKIASTATYLQVGLWSNYNGGSGVQYITGITVVEKSTGDLIVDGAITATKLSANSIAVGTAAIENGAINNAMIKEATIDSAKIANLSASKITAGDIAVGQTIASSGKDTNGVAKWSISGDGVATFKEGVFSGSLYGADISGANGTFSGVLSAGSVDFSSSIGTTTNYFTPATYTITVPTNMTSLRVTLIGGGGGGGPGGSSSATGGGSGGLASTSANMTLTGITPGTSYTLTVGAGGSGGINFTYPYGDSTYDDDYWADPVITQGAVGGNTTLALTSTPANIIVGSAGGAGGQALNLSSPYVGSTGTHTGTGGLGTGGGTAATYLSGFAGGVGVTNSGAGGGGGYGTETGTTATNGGIGGTGKAILEFINSNGVVLRAEMSILKTELRNQNLILT